MPHQPNLKLDRISLRLQNVAAHWLQQKGIVLSEAAFARFQADIEDAFTLAIEARNVERRSHGAGGPPA